MKIGYLGPKGSFTYEVAYSKYRQELTPLVNISSVFKEVQDNNLDYGIVPIENSIHGSVIETIDNLKKFDLKIVRELKLKIHHQFCSNENSVNNIIKIYSKDVAYNQCKNFIKKNKLENINFIPVESTSKGAEIVVNEPNSGVICSKMSADLFKLKVLYKNIEDSKDNETRFIVLSKNKISKNKNKKISIIAKIDNMPGSLCNFLEQFSKNNVNLTKIESRPDKDDKNFNYWFYIEFEGNIDDLVIKKILENGKIKYLGNY
jgi:chorismate mutase/prephenate dehydratase